MGRPKEYYSFQLPSGWTENPLEALYASDIRTIDDVWDLNVSCEVKSILSQIVEWAEKIAGDFDLDETTAIMKEDIFAYIKVGSLASIVKLKGLYKKSYISFKSFCEQGIGMSYWQVNRWIESAGMAIEFMINGCPAPKNESQARVLLKLPKEQREAAYRKICEKIPEHKRTAKAISEELGLVEAGSKNVRIKPGTYARIKAQADASGLSVEELLDQIFSDEPPAESEEKVANWPTEEKNEDTNQNRTGQRELSASCRNSNQESRTGTRGNSLENPNIPGKTQISQSSNQKPQSINKNLEGD